MGKRAKRKRLEKEQRKAEEKQQLEDRAKQALRREEDIRLPKPAVGRNLANIAPQPGFIHNPNMRLAAAADSIIEHIKGRKVISFLQDAFDCCGEKCILEYTPLFQADGYASLMVPRQNYKDILKYLSEYVVLFRLGHKDCPPEEIHNLVQYVNHLKSLGIRVTYYADDLIFWANKNAPQHLIKASDAVIVTNEVLRQILIQKVGVTQPIVIVPTHLSIPAFDALKPGRPIPLSNKFKILTTSQGRIGINHTYAICELVNEDPELAAATEWIYNANGVAQVRSVINKFRNMHKTYIDWISLQDYYSLAKSVDLIIHPAHPDDLAYMCPEEFRQPWLDSKSEVKYTLSGASRIPIISSPVYSYRNAIKDGETGFLADTPEEFVAKIKELVNNKELCRRIGEAARKDVEEKYHIKVRYPQYRDAIIGKDIEAKAVTTIMPELRGYKGLFIPPMEGGPRTFYENMKRWLPIVTNKKWQVTENLTHADAAIAIAFIMANDLIKAKEANPQMKLIYRLDGLPMNFDDELDPINLALMQKMFHHADTLVWQSEHCLKMWRDKNLVPHEINPDGPIIHNGVDLEVFCTRGNPYELPKPAKYNLLNLNWSTFKHKRLDLLQKFIKDCEDNPDIKFYLIGNYISTSQLANVNFFKEFPNATYIGQMRNMSRKAKEVLASVYRASTALIFTSEMEGSPNTVLEALGCGCPIIYNENSDIVPEILGSACVPISQWEKILDEDYRQEIKKKMVTIAERFSMEECCRKYIALVEE